MRLSDQTFLAIAEQLPAPSERGPDADFALTYDLGSYQVQYRRTYETSVFLMIAFGGSRVRLPNRTRSVNVGFISLASEILNSSNLPLPDIFGSEHLADFGFPYADGFTFGLLALTDGSDVRQALIGQIGDGGRPFPVIATPMALVRHGTPPHPGHPSGVGSGACWVAYNGSGTSGWTKGILTARHVVEGLPVGTSVTLDASASCSSPTQGWIADPGVCQIDAAILGIDPADWPSGLATLSVSGPYKFPTPPGAPLGLDARSGTTPCRLLSHHALPGYWGSMISQWLVVDGSANPGDSGCIAASTASGAGLGIYIGEINDGGGGLNGLCQDLRQASIFLEADLYR